MGPIQNTLRHMQRYRELATVFSKNGLGFFIKDLGLHETLSIPKRMYQKDFDMLTDDKIGSRLRKVIEELGPTFVKIGQIASTRPDLLPEGIINELKKLQNNVPAFSYEEAKEIVEAELNDSLENIFDDFEQEAFAAASIGQVHKARLKTGEAVAVKVQRPHIEHKIKVDLEILHNMAHLATKRLEWAARYDLEEIVNEFSKTLLAELDYRIEANNSIRIANQFKDNPHIKIPQVYEAHSTKKVLTMEYVQGIKLNDIEKLDKYGYDKELLAERTVQAIFEQILMEGFYHGDPHPGNLVTLPGEVVVFMDFGMVGQLTHKMKNQFVDLLLAVVQQNTTQAVNGILKMGVVPREVNRDFLWSEVKTLQEKYYDTPLSEVSLGVIVNEVFSIAYKYDIELPKELTFLGKTLLTIEGTATLLDPDISIVKVAEPIGRKLLKEKYNPKNIVDQFFRKFQDASLATKEVTEDLKQIASIAKKGHLPIEIELKKQEILVGKLERISNRLSFSLILLALSIILAGLIIGSSLTGYESLLWQLPVIEIGVVIIFVMFVLILFSIFRSGRM